MNTLDEILKRKNKTFEQLTADERIVYNRWESVLIGGKIDLERLKEFMRSENERLLPVLIDAVREKKESRVVFTAAQLEYGRLILAMLEGPEKSAKFLENYLKRVFSIKE